MTTFARRRTAQTAAAIALLLLALCAVANSPAQGSTQQDYAVVYIDPNDGVQKVRVPNAQHNGQQGLQWALTQQGRPVAYNASVLYPTDNPQAYQVFAFFSYHDAPVQQRLDNPLDPYVFVFEEVVLEDFGATAAQEQTPAQAAEAAQTEEETAVQRIALRWADYQQWTEREIDKVIIRIEGGQLQLPTGADPRAFAEWTHYYNQLRLWERFLRDDIFIGDYDALMNEFHLPTDTSAVREVMPLIHENFLHIRDIMVGQIEDENLDFHQRMQKRREARERYEEWRIEQQQAILEFAEIWGRRARGTEVVVEGTPFIITREKLDNPPKDRIEVVNESENLTPYDILGLDGALKQVDEN